MSVRAKARRMVVACVMICATVGMFIAPHVSAAVDPKMERKLFADYYRPGMDGVALDQAILKALPKTERTARAKADAAAASQCGEYQCQWDWGTGIWACFSDGEYAYLFPGQQARCDCYDGGDCYWEW